MALGLAIALPGYSVSEPNEPMVMEPESEPSPPMFYSEPFSPIDMIGGKEAESWLNEKFMNAGISEDQAKTVINTYTPEATELTLSTLDWILVELELELLEPEWTPEQRKNFLQLRIFLNFTKVDILKQKMGMLATKVFPVKSVQDEAKPGDNVRRMLGADR